MSHRTQRMITPIIVAAILIVIFAIPLIAQSGWTKIDNIQTQKIRITNDIDSRGTATLAYATITNLTAPTVTMTSATTWTVSSLTAETGLSAGSLTAGTLTVTGTAAIPAGTFTTITATTANLTSANVTTGTIAAAVITTANVTTSTVTSSAVTTGTVTSLTAGALTVNGNAAITGTAKIDGAATITGALTTIDGVTVGGLLILAKQSNVTVTDGSTITPTTSYVPLTSAGNVGTSSIATGAAGQLLRLVNVGSNTITISDTGTLKLSADIALGQYDSLLLMGDGTNWVQMGTSNN